MEITPDGHKLFNTLKYNLLICCSIWLFFFFLMSCFHLISGFFMLISFVFFHSGEQMKWMIYNQPYPARLYSLQPFWVLLITL